MVLLFVACWEGQNIGVIWEDVEDMLLTNGLQLGIGKWVLIMSSGMLMTWMVQINHIPPFVKRFEWYKKCSKENSLFCNMPFTYGHCVPIDKWIFNMHEKESLLHFRVNVSELW